MAYSGVGALDAASSDTISEASRTSAGVPLRRARRPAGRPWRRLARRENGSSGRSRATPAPGAAGVPASLTVAGTISAVSQSWFMMTPGPYLLGRPVCLSMVII